MIIINNSLKISLFGNVALYTSPSGKKVEHAIKVIRKKEKKIMPKELVKEYLGKVCLISVLDDAFGISGKIVAVEDGWIKVQTRKEDTIINGDFIRSITLLSQKAQDSFNKAIKTDAE